MAYAATDAAAYERSMGRWSRRLAEPFLDAAALPAGAQVLDAGCGTGALSEAIRTRDPTARLHGIDLGAPFIEAARQRVPGATFQVADIQALPFGAGSFDAALSLLVLAFVPDPALAACELRRVTRPGGTVAAAMWDFWGGFPFMRQFADTAAVLLPAAEAWRASQYRTLIGQPGHLGALLAQAGCTAVAECDLLIRMTFADFEDWLGPWRGGQGIIGAFYASLPPADRDMLDAPLRRAWQAGGVDGPRSFAAVARMATGRA